MGRQIAVLITVAMICGCTVYTFNPGGKSSIQSVAIERFENKTAEFGLADQMTDIIIDAFLTDGNLKVLSRESADAVLVGSLAAYSRKPFEFDESDQVQTYSVTMTFDLSFKKPDSESDIWTERMTQIGYYDAQTETEEDGQEEALALLVDAIIDKTTKSW
ncbi:MAG: LPS assembly lipoprotein LptE [Candidatus Zixiibacteriota bacterium]